ncbi:hypothetical protein KEM48_004178 [Puccinia striiformis f. sp. tritici PST-130]|nr:hypothetical protein KEM48_004178 [Puccinia striiformis f. sp. tritici PST-130]
MTQLLILSLNSSITSRFPLRVFGPLDGLQTCETLRLCYDKRFASGNVPVGDRRISFHHDIDLLCSLLSGAQGLKCLDNDQVRSTLSRRYLNMNLARVQLPNITHLVAGFGLHRPTSLLV